MADEIENVEDTNENENENEDVREEETKDEIRDNDYVNDDEVEILRNIEKRFNEMNEKLDNVVAMIVDAGAIVQETNDSDTIDEDEYDKDFINLDELDLSL